MRRNVLTCSMCGCNCGCTLLNMVNVSSISSRFPVRARLSVKWLMNRVVKREWTTEDGLTLNYRMNRRKFNG